MYELDNESILNVIKLSNAILTYDKDRNNLSLPFSLFFQEKLNVPFNSYVESSLSYLNNIQDINQKPNNSFNDNENDSEKEKESTYSIDKNSENNLANKEIIEVYNYNLEQYYENLKEKNEDTTKENELSIKKNIKLRGAKKKIIINREGKNDNKIDNNYDNSNRNNINLINNNKNKISYSNDKINHNKKEEIKYNNNNNNNNNKKSKSNDKIKNYKKEDINDKYDKSFFKNKNQNKYINYSLYNKEFLYINHDKTNILNEMNLNKDDGEKKKDALIKEKEMLTSILIKKIAHNNNDIKDIKEINNKEKENLLEINLTRNVIPNEKLEKKRQIQKEKQLKKKKKGVPEIDFKIDFSEINKKYDEARLNNLIKDSEKK